MKSFRASELQEFGAAYPEHPRLLGHELCDHPLLRLEALVELAGRIRASDVEYNRSDLPVGIEPDAIPRNGLGIEETIRSIESCGSWMVLKRVEQDPLYRDLLESVLDEVAPIVAPLTGPMLNKEAFIFISSPDAVTPFHFDPEHNILLQIRGRKTMTIFPPDDDELVSGRLHEIYHNGGHRNLPWSDDFAAKGVAHELIPGKAVYVPVKAPHWVKNGSEPSISFSITWRSEWSYREEYARGLNDLLRRAGFDPAPPRRYPHQNRAKSAAYRMIQRAHGAVTGTVR